MKTPCYPQDCDPDCPGEDVSTVSVNRVNLGRIQKQSRMTVSDDFFICSTTRDQALKAILIDMKMELCGLTESVTITHPDGWIEALKYAIYSRRWAPQWFIRRHPVKMQQHVITAAAMFPNLRFPRGITPYFDIMEMRRG